MTANVDCTMVCQTAKAGRFSFYLYYPYKSLLVVNAIENFRYRIENKQPVLYDRIHASTTVLKKEDTFGFVFLPYHEQFKLFQAQARKQIEEAKQVDGFCINIKNARLDVIHSSAIPWISFTSVVNEHSGQPPEGIPRIIFGKYFRQDNRLLMPVSIYAHHGLMDGLPIGQFFENFGNLLDSASA